MSEQEHLKNQVLYITNAAYDELHYPLSSIRDFKKQEEDNQDDA
ncbi:hypothetical protein [Bacillus sp. HMF5848]|nr:hypothetical protein [Bacillus sp. HMF5848]